MANHSPYPAERIWCYWVGGFSNVQLKGHIDKKVDIVDNWFRKTQADDCVVEKN